MKLADMHVHTSVSDGIWDMRKYLCEAQKRGLSGLAITDHDNVQAGYAARELAAREFKDIEVIPGVEVSTATMHLLVYFPQSATVDNLPLHQSVFKTSELALKLGGVVATPHPEHKSTASATHTEIKEMARLGYFPMVEIFNASVHDVSLGKRFRRLPTTNDLAKNLFEEIIEILGAPIGGTDAHFRTVGRGLVAYEGTLEEALLNKKTSVVYTGEWEKLWPWDILIHSSRLKEMDIWRADNFSPDTGEYIGDWR